MASTQPEPGSSLTGDLCGELQARLGLTIADAALAVAALTHKSFVNEHRGEGLQDNERLEFLGDAVIDLAVSHRLMEHFPDAREGELSKIRASLVDEAGLAGIARSLGLGGLLRLGRGEELTGGRDKSSILADAMEAVVAALYLGGGLAPVLALIDRFLGDAFARAAAGTLDRDYKTQLQELAHSRLRASPRYRVVAEHGPDHSKVFDVELEVKGEVVGRGTGRSKKDAEQAAAKLAIPVLAERIAGSTPVEAPRPATPEPAAEVAGPVPEAAAIEGVQPAVAPEEALREATSEPAAGETGGPPGVERSGEGDAPRGGGVAAPEEAPPLASAGEGGAAQALTKAAVERAKTRGQGRARPVRKRGAVPAGDARASGRKKLAAGRKDGAAKRPASRKRDGAQEARKGSSAGRPRPARKAARPRARKK